MRDALQTPRTYRFTIAGILVGRTVRSATDETAIAACVAAGSLSAIAASTFGLFSGTKADDSCSITSGLKALTSPGNPWTADDVGKAIHVAGAGAAGAVLSTRIATYVSAGSITTVAAAGTTVAASSTSAGGLAAWGDDLSETTPLPVNVNPPGTEQLAAPRMTAQGSPTSRTLAQRLADIGNVRDFGAVGDGVTDDRAAVQLAIDTMPVNGGILFFPIGIYKVEGKINLKKGARLIGAGLHETYIVGDGTATVLLETPDSSTDVEITGFQFQINGASDICINIKGSSRAHIHGNRFYNASGNGIAIKLDQNSVAGAYNHYIHENDCQGMASFIVVAGFLTSTTITNNKVISDNAISFTGASAGSGGNFIAFNLLQSRTGTMGTKAGIGIASSNCVRDVIFANYFELFLQAVRINIGSDGTQVLNNHYDNNTENVSSAITNFSHDYVLGDEHVHRWADYEWISDDGDSTLKLKNQLTNKFPFEVDAADRVKILGEISVDTPYSFAGNGETMEPGSSRMVTITGNGAPRTGAIIGISGAVNGQRLLLLGNSWAVTFAATNCVFSSIGVPTIGNNAGNVATIEFVYSSAESKWYEISRCVRA